MLLDIWNALRTFLWRATDIAELDNVDTVLDSNRSIELCHVADDDMACALAILDESGPVVVPAEAVTRSEVLEVLRASPRVSTLGSENSSILVFAHEAGTKLQARRMTMSPHAILALIIAIGSALVIGLGANVVASAEDFACRKSSCDERPADYWSAVYWLLNRLSGGDPNGLGAETVAGRTVGIVVTASSLFFVAVLVSALTARIKELRPASAVDAVEIFNQRPEVAESQPIDRLNGATGGDEAGDGKRFDPSDAVPSSGAQPEISSLAPNALVTPRTNETADSRGDMKQILAFAVGAGAMALAIAAVGYSKKLLRRA